MFHAFSKAVGPMDETAFLRWMRVCRNLLISHHTEVSAATLAPVIRAVETLAAGSPIFMRSWPRMYASDQPVWTNTNGTRSA